METSRLKNIIILILVLVNLFLLGFLGVRRTSEYAAHSRSVSELTSLFADDGVTLETRAVVFDDPPQALTLTRDIELDQKMAVFFLGSSVTVSDEGGGIYAFTSAAGRVDSRASGSFQAAGSLGGDPASVCRTFCRSFGYRDLAMDFDKTGTGTATAQQYVDNYPVVGCTVTFQVTDGEIRSVSGTHLPSGGTVDTSASSLSAVSALTAFLEARRAEGAVVSAVSDVAACYMLQSSAASPMALVPVWRLTTDTVNYYVNCSTGNVTHD